MQKAKQRLMSLVVACVMVIACLFGAIATLVIPQTTAMAAETSSEVMSIKATEGTLAADSSNISWDGTDFTLVNYKNTSSTAIRTTDSNHFRVYVGNKTTFTSKNNKKITQIVITTVSNYTLILNTSGKVDVGTLKTNGTTTTITFDEPTQNCTITTTKQWRLSKVEITYAETGTEVEVPTEITDALNKVEATMSLSYSYTVTEQAIPAGVTFELGADGVASHSDGAEPKNNTYNETVGGYTLSLTGGEKMMYTGARDAKGNSCLKLGTGSVAGGFSFNAPDDITSVIIYIAKYKANNATITINGTEKVLDKNSNDGEYNEITVDTTTTKTITLNVSSGYRAMVNSIIFANDKMESAGTEKVVEKDNSEFRIRFSVDASLAKIANLEALDSEKTLELGIRVSAGTKIAHYAISECQTLKNADEIIKYYVVISLGDIFNDDIKLGTDFTVQAYAKYDGKEVLPTEPVEDETTNAIKTYSVKSMVAAYYSGEKATAETTARVAHLYNYLTNGEL